MSRRPQVREWRDDIPRSFTYEPPVSPAAPARRPRGLTRVLVTLLLGH